MTKEKNSNQLNMEFEIECQVSLTKDFRLAVILPKSILKLNNIYVVNIVFKYKIVQNTDDFIINISPMTTKQQEEKTKGFSPHHYNNKNNMIVVLDCTRYFPDFKIINLFNSTKCKLIARNKTLIIKVPAKRKKYTKKTFKSSLLETETQNKSIAQELQETIKKLNSLFAQEGNSLTITIHSKSAESVRNYRIENPKITNVSFTNLINFK